MSKVFLSKGIVNLDNIKCISLTEYVRNNGDILHYRMQVTYYRDTNELVLVYSAVEYDKFVSDLTAIIKIIRWNNYSKSDSLILDKSYEDNESIAMALIGNMEVLRYE